MPELRGECLRAARAALSRLAGKADGEAVLDAIFGQFCIGK
jgi:tRNA modification GTPase